MAQKSRYAAMDIAQVRQTNQTQEAEQTKGKKRSEDSRFWKPVVNKKDPKSNYQAKVRLLPQGETGVLDLTMPFAVKQCMHYIKEPELNLFLFVKCRKTFGENEPCPICDTNWAMWRVAKQRNDTDLMKKSLSRQHQTTYIGNVFIRQDLTNPDNNGQVRLWEHTKKIHATLTDPSKEVTEEDKQDEGFKKVEAKEIFIPQCVINGRDRIVIANIDKENKALVSYSDSFWDDKGASPLDENDDQIASILDQCYDLKEFMNDVPSVEDLASRYQEFNSKVADAGGQAFVNSSPDAAKIPQGDASAFLKDTPAPAMDEPLSKNESQEQAPVPDIPDDAAQASEDDLPF